MCVFIASWIIIIIIIISPPSPAEEHTMEMYEGGRGHGGNCLGVHTAPLLCYGRACKASERMFSWSSLLTTSLKIVLFCKNGHSYKKNKKMEIVSARTIKKYVHWLLLIDELHNQPPWKENAILQSWGGAISMVWKNLKLFVACLSVCYPYF